MLRFKQFTSSMGAAVILSTVIFGAGHAYQGWTGVGVTTVIGLIFSFVYLWRGSLMAPMVMHFLTDLMSLVIAPMLMRMHQ